MCLNTGSIQAQTKNDQTIKYSHGVYVGEVANGKANGQGTYTAAKTGTIYSGQFVNDTFSGQGTMLWKNGDKFVGIWKNDSATGGTMSFAGGRTASGVVQNGMFKEAVASNAGGNKFPNELIGNWGPKQGCIAEITKDGFEEGGGIISCTLVAMKSSANGFTGNLNCSADGNPVKRSIKYENGNLVISGEKYSRCKP